MTYLSFFKVLLYHTFCFNLLDYHLSYQLFCCLWWEFCYIFDISILCYCDYVIFYLFVAYAANISEINDNFIIIHILLMLRVSVVAWDKKQGGHRREKWQIC